MHPGEHSRTAEFMALFRALETARGSNTRLFCDPWARGFLGLPLRVTAELGRLPLAGQLLCRFIDWRWPGARSSGVARTRYIDDILVGALSGGIGQVVLLGAGFDCRAYRIPQMLSARVFEVDHPDTSRIKQARIRAVLGEFPSHVTFVAMDFNRENLGLALQDAGFDLSRRAFFLWEGVTQYLTAEAVDETLRYAASAAAGSQILFTYVDEKVLDPEPLFAGIKALNHALREAAEPWVSGFDPAGLARYLDARGLRLLTDLGAADYRALYMKRAGRFRGYEFYRVAVAEVVGKPAASSQSEDAMTGKNPEHA
jgi:methyltransferase (TIGR00027 family)